MRAEKDGTRALFGLVMGRRREMQPKNRLLLSRIWRELGPKRHPAPIRERNFTLVAGQADETWTSQMG